MNENNKLFTRDFTLVVIGQIISLFGNSALRFAIPLYLLNQTGSSAIFGTVTALAFIPAILMSPIGGIVADRVNKRNIMVFLDFFTAALITIFYFALSDTNFIVLVAGMLMILYGIASAYQPSVQSSLPFIVSEENLLAGNSVINSVNSLSSLLGPVIGGILYSAYGLDIILIMSIACFTLSAIMEIFIHIPFIKQETQGNFLKIAKDDFSESLHFIKNKKPIMIKVLLAICAFNFFFSAMIIIGLPYLITEVLDFTKENANRLYGFAEGALAAGGLAGGILAGIISKKLSIQKAGKILLLCSLCIFPIGISLLIVKSAMINYIIITLCCFVLMGLSMIFTIQMMSFVQAETPPHLIGKVIAVILTVSMCAHPLGNAMYGVLFGLCQGFEYVIIFFAGIISLMIALKTGSTFKNLK